MIGTIYGDRNMIAHIEGIVSAKTADAVVLDVHGIGFLIGVSGATMSQVPATGAKMKLYTVLNVREDAMELFGFYSIEERKMYERLIGVSGIGSRSAMQILSSLSVHDLSVALVTGDAGALVRVPGIGKKIAQRLVLELKDKIDDQELVGAGAKVAPVRRDPGPQAEAVAALLALGFSASEAEKAVSAAAAQTTDLEEMIRIALKGRG